jgi:hypothetical protein
MSLPPEAQFAFERLMAALKLRPEAGQRIVLHVDTDGELGLVEAPVFLRKQKPVARQATTAHTQPRDTQQFVGRSTAMR